MRQGTGCMSCRGHHSPGLRGLEGFPSVAAMSPTMKAMILREFGGPEVLCETEIPRPGIRPGHLLVRVRASSVNPVDAKIRRGMLAAIAPDPPTVLGCDMAGVVEEVGEGVNDFAVGDEVYGCASGVKGCGGALAEWLVADAALVARKPQTLSFAEAAALPLVGITSWEGLFDRADLQTGRTALVHGGAGGVGHMAVQLAVSRGARVFATVSTSEKAALVRRCGAEPVFYREKSVQEYVDECTGGAGFDLVFDTVGGDNVAGSFAAAAVCGTVVSISTRTTADLSPLHAKGLSLHVVFMLIPMLFNLRRARHGEILRQIAALAEAGKLQPIIDPQQFSFREAAAAHAHLESGRAVGKIVLTGF